jgi:hypothetical protein
MVEQTKVAELRVSQAPKPSVCV